jgi:hypothetical protein
MSVTMGLCAVQGKNSTDVTWAPMPGVREGKGYPQMTQIKKIAQMKK